MAHETNRLVVENYKSVFEASPGICTLLKANSPEFTILAVTDEFLTVSQKTREEIYGKPLFEVFPSNPLSGNFTGENDVSASLRYILTNKKIHQFTSTCYDIPNADGTFTKKYWQVNNKPVFNDAGDIAYIIHAIVDITDNINAEGEKKTLKLAEQTYKLFMQAPMAICILKGNDFVVELANEKILQIWRKDERVLGKTLLEALPEIKGTAFPDLLSNVLSTGENYYANESSATFIKEGKEELVYFNFVYQPYYEDDSDQAVGVLAIANEVTEQVLARRKIEESELRYRTLISEAVVATAVYEGREMRIQFANDAMLRLWGKDATVLGKVLKEALPELDGQPFHGLLDDVFVTGETYWGKEDKGEIVVNGQLQTFFFNFTYKALRNAQGEIYGILNMAIDVTQQVSAQNALKENEINLQRIVDERTRELQIKNKELEYSNEELQQFAYIASHDLQEPLRKIRTFSDILSTHIEPEAETRRYADKINASAERMSGLINSLLDYSKLARGSIRYEKVDLNLILQNVLSDYELLILQKNALIKPENLPIISAVPLLINQLFYNLIGNALKFTKRNIQPVISITCTTPTPDQKSQWELDPQKEYIEIVVRDNGIGFDQTYADKIFTIFQRLNERSQYGGYGIGLALCKKVIDAHKGRIFAEGKLKEGATFNVILPERQ
jgi:PAS domain S-box-containing protein